MNLVQLATELEYVPKDQLAQMSQDPNNRFPQYLVLSEIQRRTANEKAYAAAQPQPTTTIAEEVVGEFMQPQGLQAGMPSVSAPTDSFSTEPMGMPASAPMQQPMMGMAEGGLTEYMEEVSSELQRIKEKESRYAARNKKQEEGETIFSTSLSPKNYVIPDEKFKKLTDKGMVRAFDAYRPMGLLFNALSGEGAFSGMDRTIPESKLKGLESAMKQSRNEMRQRQQGLASGGLTAYANGGSLEQSFADPYTNVLGSSTNPYPTEYIEDEEDLKIKDLQNPLAFATALLSLDPRRKALMFAGKKAKGLLGAIKRRYKKDDIDLGPTGMPAGKIKVGNQTYDPSKVVVPRTGVDLKKVVTDPLITVPAGLGTAYSISSLSDESVDASSKSKTETEAEKQLRLQNEAQKKELDALRNKATGTAKPKKEIDYDLVGLGGLIMGSKNISDLGMGLAGLAESKQNRQAAKEKLDLERQLTEAQVMSLEGKSKYADTEALQSYLTAKKQQISDQLDSGLLSQERAAKELEKLAPAEARLIQMYEMLFGGIANSANSDEDFLKSLSA